MLLDSNQIIAFKLLNPIKDIEKADYAKLKEYYSKINLSEISTIDKYIINNLKIAIN